MHHRTWRAPVIAFLAILITAAVHRENAKAATAGEPQAISSAADDAQRQACDAKNYYEFTRPDGSKGKALAIIDGRYIWKDRKCEMEGFFAALPPPPGDATVKRIDQTTALAKGCEYLRQQHPEIQDCKKVTVELSVAGPELGGHIWLAQVPNPAEPPDSFLHPSFYVVVSTTDGHLIDFGVTQR